MLGGTYPLKSPTSSSSPCLIGFYAFRILRLSKIQTYLSFAFGGGLSGWYIYYVGKEPQVAKAERIKTIKLHQMRMERESFQNFSDAKS